MSSQLTAQWSVYSPDLIVQGDQVMLYLGGWGNEQRPAFEAGVAPRDTIYRANLAAPDSIVPVLRPQDHGLGLLNDPSIVNMGSYWIMYMTCVVDPTPGAGNDARRNAIYWSVSWANDGVNWSPPAPLANDLWLPAAIKRPGEDVRLYANSNIDGLIYRVDLGSSGVVAGARTAVALPKPYRNIKLDYIGTVGRYQMLAQFVAADNSSSTIDRLTSHDGLSWIIADENLLPDVRFAITPAGHPFSDAYVYHGAAETLDGPWNVFIEQWT